MLARHYEHFRKMPHEVSKRMAVIIVDDGSPNYPAWGEYIGMKLSVYRVGVNVRWNQDACRNIGVHHTETQWVLLTDMDHMLPVKTAEYLVNNKFDGRIAYKFTRVSEPDMSFYKSHPNSWFHDEGALRQGRRLRRAVRRKLRNRLGYHETGSQRRRAFSCSTRSTSSACRAK
jgi:hypothetical protein